MLNTAEFDADVWIWQTFTMYYYEHVYFKSLF